MDYNALGRRIRIKRIELNYTQEELAEMVNVGQRYISKIETGMAKPEFAKIYEIAVVLGVSLDYLVGYHRPKDMRNYYDNSIMIRLQLLSGKEKEILLKMIECYIESTKNTEQK